jgi:hypothetical protein
MKAIGAVLLAFGLLGAPGVADAHNVTKNSTTRFMKVHAKRQSLKIDPSPGTLHMLIAGTKVKCARRHAGASKRHRHHLATCRYAIKLQEFDGAKIRNRSCGDSRVRVRFRSIRSRRLSVVRGTDRLVCRVDGDDHTPPPPLAPAPGAAAPNTTAAPGVPSAPPPPPGIGPSAAGRAVSSATDSWTYYTYVDWPAVVGGYWYVYWLYSSANGVLYILYDGWECVITCLRTGPGYWAGYWSGRWWGFYGPIIGQIV